MRLKHFPRVVFLLILFYACQSPKYESEEKPFANFNLNYIKDIQKLKSAQIESSPWGIHFNGMPFHDMAFAQYDSLDIPKLSKELPVLIKKSNELGLKWARISVDWGLIEDYKGEFHWELLDKMIDGLVASGIEVYPSLHAGHVTHTQKKPPTTPKEIEAWLNFVNQVVSRYKDKITYWEIWNEPNTTWFWGGNPNAEEYYNLVKASSLLIKSKDPSCKIIGGSLARLDVPYAEQLFKFGIADYIDVFSFHPYGVFPESALKKMKVQVKMPLLYEPVMNTVDGLQSLIKSSGKPIELWQGECGYPSAMNGGGWNGTGPYSEEIQAKWILRRAMVDLSYDAQVSAYFLLKNTKHKYYDHYNHKGLLDYHDLKPKKGYEVFQNLTSIFNGKLKRQPNVKVDFNLIDDGELHGIRTKNIKSVTIQKNNRQLLAYWGVTHLQSKVNPGKVTLEVSGLNPSTIKTIELIDLYNGKTYKVNTFKVKNNSLIIPDLPLNDYPFVLTMK